MGLAAIEDVFTLFAFAHSCIKKYLEILLTFVELRLFFYIFLVASQLLAI